MQGSLTAIVTNCDQEPSYHSDSRSGSIVDDRIRPTLEAGTAVGSTKPVLLVIDEIDGATGAGDNVRINSSKHHLNKSLFSLLGWNIRS